MEIIWINLIILANVFVYIRKIMLVRRGYKVAWFVVWSDWGKFVKLIETNRSSARRKLLFAINIAPCLLLVMGILLAIIDWTN